MKNKIFNRYYFLSCFCVLLFSYYPLSMGVRVITDMIVNGTVLKENYPKYIIPYTPISIALIVGIFLMPLYIKLFKKFALLGGTSISISAFFVIEFLLEQKVVVSTAETVAKLEDWQMFMCYQPPEGMGSTTYKTQTAVDILMGDYNPAFKLHFYIISVVLIITILNGLYGFGQMIKTGEKKRLKSLVLQSVCSFTFLALCILACFTAFWRDGSIQVSPLSAILMSMFFILLGVTVGVFVGSFLLEKRRLVSIWIPSIVASVMTLLMYIGEMFLLNGYLYSFGSGIIFDGLPGIVFAPIDLLIILASGCITALIFTLLNRNRDCSKMKKKRLIITLSITGAVIAFVLLFVSSIVGADGTKEAYSTVQFLEKKSDVDESSYQVGVTLPSTDFSLIGQTLADKMAQEWETFDGMSKEQQLLSSKLWGVISFQTDTWSGCEDAIGFTVSNPLESLDWLNKTGYFGMESADPDLPVKHVQVIANAAQTTDRKLSEISLSAGYNTENARVTLTATLSANEGTYTTGCISNGYATYEQSAVTTGSGIQALSVITNETNNTGYYNGDYFDLNVYWVKDNVFYTLHVFGDDTDKAEIQTTFERILKEV